MCNTSKKKGQMQANGRWSNQTLVRVSVAANGDGEAFDLEIECGGEVRRYPNRQMKDYEIEKQDTTVLQSTPLTRKTGRPMHEAWREAMNGDKKRVLLQAGRRWGKTNWGAIGAARNIAAEIVRIRSDLDSADLIRWAFEVTKNRAVAAATLFEHLYELAAAGKPLPIDEDNQMTNKIEFDALSPPDQLRHLCAAEEVGSIAVTQGRPKVEGGQPPVRHMPTLNGVAVDVDGGTFDTAAEAEAAGNAVLVRFRKSLVEMEGGDGEV